MTIQIDVKNVVAGVAECRMTIGDRDVICFMPEPSYRELIADGFFLRDGKEKDGSGVLNTTAVYIPEPPKAL